MIYLLTNDSRKDGSAGTGRPAGIWGRRVMVPTSGNSRRKRRFDSGLFHKRGRIPAIGINLQSNLNQR